LIKGPTVCGIVQVARGCGLGCDFCVPTLLKFRCIPVDRVLREVKVNINGGKQPLLHAEDVLRYGARGLQINKEAVINLFKSVKNFPGVHTVGVSHSSLSSVFRAPDLIEEISNILGAGERIPWIGVQVGIETGSPSLIKSHMPGKCKPFSPEKWPDIVLSSFEILSQNNWVPCATAILGLPGETEKDVELTISLVKKLKPFKSLIVPLFFVSTNSPQKSFTVDMMTPKHSELFFTCWEHNFEWVPKLLQESFRQRSVRDSLVRIGLKVVASQAIQQARRLIDVCRYRYNYDLKALIQDFRSGHFKLKLPLFNVKFCLIK
jgi:radical SAM superfamily enzyme YgiQ (UPF0313 family)